MSLDVFVHWFQSSAKIHYVFISVVVTYLKDSYLPVDTAFLRSAKYVTIIGRKWNGNFNRRIHQQVTKPIMKCFVKELLFVAFSVVYWVLFLEWHGWGNLYYIIVVISIREKLTNSNRHNPQILRSLKKLIYTAWPQNGTLFFGFLLFFLIKYRDFFIFPN